MPELDLDALILSKGHHKDRDDGMCLMEAAAWLAGQPHTDHPPCVSPVLGIFGRALNDVLPDTTRQQLKPYLRPMLGTAGDGKDRARSYLALDWLIRTWLPAWLDLAGLASHATALQELEPVTSIESAETVTPTITAARDAARDAARAARDAARDAAWDAARAAAWDAGAAARAAAWDAARDAARDAGAAAGAAARAAARDAARAAAWDAGAAARAAAWAALAPTVSMLQADAIRLFGVMIDA
jgi:hypothetical protein